MARRLVTLAALAAVMGVILALWAWRRPVSGAAPLLTLLVNGQSQLRIESGTPLTFEIFLTGRPQTPRLTIGAVARPWHSMVVLRAAADTELRWPFVPLGTPRTLSMPRTNGAIKPVVGHNHTAIVEGAAHVHATELAIAPEVSAGIPAGFYRVRAAIATPWWQFRGWRGHVESAPVQIQVVDPSPANTAARSRSAASFYIRARRYEDARRIADELLKATPDSADANVIAGDALHGLGRFAEALDAYRTALRVVTEREPQRYESPDLLLARIRMTQEQLKRRLGSGAATHR